MLEQGLEQALALVVLASLVQEPEDRGVIVVPAERLAQRCLGGGDGAGM